MFWSLLESQQVQPRPLFFREGPYLETVHLEGVVTLIRDIGEYLMWA